MNVLFLIFVVILCSGGCKIDGRTAKEWKELAWYWENEADEWKSKYHTLENCVQDESIYNHRASEVESNCL